MLDIREKMLKPKNVVITCSKAGKLTTSLVYYWRDNILVPNVSTKSLFLSDAWPRQRDEEIYTNVPGCKFLAIPKITTDRIQPLDVLYNRQMKSIIRRAYDRVILDELHISMSRRDNIIRLVPLVHSQMSAKVFQDLVRYACHACGYVDNHPGAFETV